jgi:hypothetical protein
MVGGIVLFAAFLVFALIWPEHLPWYDLPTR